MTDDKLAQLERWLDDICPALGVPRGQVREVTGELLVVAREVAHGACRPGAPVTLFLLGVVVAGDPEGFPERVRAAAAVVREQLS